jgi:hypothetical protein|tara:strand:+ start:47 stop:484 length:438 start_codon:yes stop_codon:yes gene_type:complete
MLHNEDISELASGISISTKFTIIKEITCKDLKAVDLVVHNLEKLKKDKFKTIKIPQFSYKVSDLIITETCEFIKGSFLSTKHEPIILNELVLRNNDYTFGDYHYTNFVIKKTTQDIYAVDFSSYGYIPDRYARNSSWVTRTKHIN